MRYKTLVEQQEQLEQEWNELQFIFETQPAQDNSLDELVRILSTHIDEEEAISKVNFLLNIFAQIAALDRDRGNWVLALHIHDLFAPLDFFTPDRIVLIRHATLINRLSLAVVGAKPYPQRILTVEETAYIREQLWRAMAHYVQAPNGKTWRLIYNAMIKHIRYNNLACTWSYSEASATELAG